MVKNKDRQEKRFDWQKWWSKNWVKVILGLILIVASWLRLWKLGEIKEYLFDECYHIPPARLIAKGDGRAFEWWHGDLSTAEEGVIDLDGAYIDWLHPPIHKYWQALNILILGNNEVAWRLSSAISGVIVCFLAYYLAKLCFKKESVGLISAGILAIEPMMVVQSRVGMNDMMMIMMSLLAIVLWKKWELGTAVEQKQRQTKNAEVLRAKNNKWLWLGMSVVMGLAVATKWSAVMIMPLIAGATILSRKAEEKLQSWGAKIGQIVIFGLVAFVTYCLSYLPAIAMGHDLSHLVELHHQIFLYQSRTDLEHYRSSTPLEWMMGEKWIIYTTRPGQEPVITLKSNKILLGLGLAGAGWSLCWLVWQGRENQVKKVDRMVLEEQGNLWLILGLYGFAFLPWVLAPRILFMYHYLPALPYLYILLSYWLARGQKAIALKK